MKSLKMMFGIGMFALGMASAAASGYSVTLYDSLWVGTTELKPGDYKVEMQGDKAIFKLGKSSVEVPATMGSSEKKFANNAVTADGKQLIEIDFKGTTSKMLFGSPVQAAK
jgi:hypothetical protein